MELPTSLALLLFGIANFYIHEPQPQTLLEGSHYLSAAKTQLVLKRARWNHEGSLQQSPSYQQLGFRSAYSVPISEHLNISANAGFKYHSAQSRGYFEPQIGASVFIKETDQFSTFATVQGSGQIAHIFRYWEVRQLYEIDPMWSITMGWQQHWWGTGIPTYGLNYRTGPLIIHALKEGPQHKMGCTYTRGQFSLQATLAYPGPPEYVLRYSPNPKKPKPPISP